MCIAVSQSGETVDTLAALRYAKAHKQTILSVVNVPESAIARESHVVLPTLAGPEIGVASTKAFTTQLTVLLAAAIAAGRARGVLSRGRRGAAGARADRAAGARQRGAQHGGRSTAASPRTSSPRRATCSIMGRGSSFPIALEGALKLKEISYIHAEGYAGGEMKHGPIALIDEIGAGRGGGADRRHLRQDRLQLRAGEGARRQAGAAERRRRAMPAWAARRRRRSRCRRSTRWWRRSSTPCRCSCWPTTRRSPRAPTSTSRATSPRA